MKPVSGWV